jgi:hypothetical protein
MLGLPYLIPDCWLEVSLHPEGPATGQLDQGFPWFSLVPEQMLELVPKFHVALHAFQAALQMVTLKISFYTNVTLSFDFDFGLDHPGDMGEGALHGDETK